MIEEVTKLYYKCSCGRCFDDRESAVACETKHQGIDNWRKNNPPKFHKGSIIITHTGIVAYLLSDARFIVDSSGPDYRYTCSSEYSGEVRESAIRSVIDTKENVDSWKSQLTKALTDICLRDVFITTDEGHGAFSIEAEMLYPKVTEEMWETSYKASEKEQDSYA